MAATIEAILASWFSSFFEIDEIGSEKLPDGSTRYTIITTGIHPTLCELKTKIYMALASLPFKRLELESIEEEVSGPIAKRYKVTLILRPFMSRRQPHEKALGPFGVLPLKTLRE